jgi:hypothetical protein
VSGNYESISNSQYLGDPIDTIPQDDRVGVFPRTPENGVDVVMSSPPDHCDLDSPYNGDLAFMGPDCQETPMPLIKVRLFVPLHDNDGVPIEPALLCSFERNLAAIAGGWSSPGDYRGCFTFPDGRKCIDRNCVYEGAVPTQDAIQQLINLLHDLGGRMDQDSIYYEIDRTTECYVVPVKSKITTPIQAQEFSPSSHVGQA